jgi:hypothetical protein
VQRLFSQLASIRRVQIEKLATGVGLATDFGDAFLEAGFVTAKIVAHQFAFHRTRKLRACSPARLGLKS